MANIIVNTEDHSRPPDSLSSPLIIRLLQHCLSIVSPHGIQVFVQHQQWLPACIIITHSDCNEPVAPFGECRHVLRVDEIQFVLPSTISPISH